MNVGAGELSHGVAEQVARRIERDNDMEKCKNNLVLYKVAETDAEYAAD